MDEQALAVAEATPAPSLQPDRLPAPYSPARMPATAAAWARLGPGPIDHLATLLPAEACERVIAEVEASFASTVAPDKAAELGALLVGAYPRAKIDNPKVYARAMTHALGKFPADLCAQVVEHVVETCRFTPTVAEVAGALRELAARRRLAAWRARQHLEERARRQEAARLRQEAEERRAQHMAAREARKPLAVPSGPAPTANLAPLPEGVRTLGRILGARMAAGMNPADSSRRAAAPAREG